MPKRIFTTRTYVPVIAIVLLAAFPLAVFAYAILANQDTGARLCAVLYAQVARSGSTIGLKGSPGYAYYRRHPVELATARKYSRQLLRDLPCRPAALPPLR